MKEITPPTGKPTVLAAGVAEKAAFPTHSKSFMLAFTVHPGESKQGKVGISFLPESGEQAGCELQIRLGDLRAQFGPGSSDHFADQQKSLREGGAPQGAENYAIENLIGVDKPFTVRVLVKNTGKLGGSLIDAEIAGQRTMITYPQGLTVNRLAFHIEGVELKALELAPLPADD
jgi:hypothetical protein